MNIQFDDEDLAVANQKCIPDREPDSIYRPHVPLSHILLWIVLGIGSWALIFWAGRGLIRLLPYVLPFVWARG